MRLAIIGAGNVGKGLGGAAVKAGHDVTISSRNAEHYSESAKAIGARAAGTADAVRDAEVVVLAIPADSIVDTGRSLASHVGGKILVDVSNRVNPREPGSVLDGSSVSEKLQAAVPDARVVKAFNTLFASTYADPAPSGQVRDAYVAGDDDVAKASVLELAGSLGFRPIDMGPLAVARVLEGMALCNILLQIRNGWPWQSGFKLIGPTGET